MKFIFIILYCLLSVMISSKTKGGKCRSKLTKEKCEEIEIPTCVWNEKRERCFIMKKNKKTNSLI